MTPSNNPNPNVYATCNKTVVKALIELTLTIFNKCINANIAALATILLILLANINELWMNNLKIISSVTAITKVRIALNANNIGPAVMPLNLPSIAVAIKLEKEIIKNGKHSKRFLILRMRSNVRAARRGAKSVEREYRLL